MDSLEEKLTVVDRVCEMNKHQGDRQLIIIEEEIANWLFSILVTSLTTSLLLSLFL